MAWTRIEHSCGHTERTQLYGPGIERERRADWLKTVPCPECREAELAAERAAESAAAAATAREQGLCVLAGSEKQVAWAEKLRRDLLRQIEELVRDWNAQVERCAAEGQSAEWHQTIALRRQELANLSCMVAAQNQARWWIDRRDWTGKELIVEAKKALDGTAQERN